VRTPRCVAVAAALVGVLAPAASAHGSSALDGVRRTRVHIVGQTSDAATGDPTQRSSGELLAPRLRDCTETACDITHLRLTLPRGVTIGRFDVLATLPRTLAARIAVYDAAGREVHAVDLTSDAQRSAPPCCGDPSIYQLAIGDARFEAGAYTVVVYDLGGSGQFTMDVTYQARRPDRKVGKH
jgi:hypothetical protein